MPQAHEECPADAEELEVGQFLIGHVRLVHELGDVRVLDREPVHFGDVVNEILVRSDLYRARVLFGLYRSITRFDADKDQRGDDRHETYDFENVLDVLSLHVVSCDGAGFDYRTLIIYQRFQWE